MLVEYPDLSIMAASVQVREISEHEAARLAALPRLTVFPSLPSSAVAMAVGPAMEAATGKRPAMSFQMLDDRVGLAYVTEDDFPGSGIYRVTVTP